MRMPRRATWNHLKYRLGIFRTIRKHVNTIRSHVKACEIPLRNLHRATWKHMKYKSAIFRSIESHPNIMQSRLKTIEIRRRNLQIYWKPYKYHAEPSENNWNTAQKSSDQLKARQIPRRTIWTHVKIFRPVESYANTMQRHVKTCEISFRHLHTCWKLRKYHAEPRENRRNIVQESSILLNGMQLQRKAMWKHVKHCWGIFRPVESHGNTTQSHVKTREISLRNLQTCWKPCKYHAEPRENTCNIAQESSDLLKGMQIPCRATWKHVEYH